jgi:hypothetical protein
LRLAVLDTTSTTVAILTGPANRRCLKFQSAVFEKPRNSFVILRDPSQCELGFGVFHLIGDGTHFLGAKTSQLGELDVPLNAPPSLLISEIRNSSFKKDI